MLKKQIVVTKSWCRKKKHTPMPHPSNNDALINQPIFYYTIVWWTFVIQNKLKCTSSNGRTSLILLELGRRRRIALQCSPVPPDPNPVPSYIRLCWSYIKYCLQYNSVYMLYNNKKKKKNHIPKKSHIEFTKIIMTDKRIKLFMVNRIVN